MDRPTRLASTALLVALVLCGGAGVAVALELPVSATTAPTTSTTVATTTSTSTTTTGPSTTTTTAAVDAEDGGEGAVTEGDDSLLTEGAATEEEPTTTTSSSTTSSSTTSTTLPPATPGLSITVPGTTNLSSGAAGSFAASLGTVTVVDSRGRTLPLPSVTSPGWIAAVTSSSFTTTAGATIPASSIAYTSGLATLGSTVGAVPGQVSPASVGTSRTAFSFPSGARVTTTVSWNPTITVTVPSGALNGVYSGTITHSVG